MSARPRRSELDGLRGLAVVLMLGQHLMVWLWNHDPNSPLALPLTAISAAGGLAAPLFVTLAGCGSALGYRTDDPRPQRSSFRGLALLAMAYVLSLLTPSWFTLRSFYVLHLLAVGLMIGPWCARQPRRNLWILAGLLALCTATVQAGTDLPLAIGNRYMSARPLQPGLATALQDATKRALIAGHFPLLPWLMPFVVGVGAGQILKTHQRLPIRYGMIVLSLGAAGLGLGASGLWPKDIEHWAYRLTAPQVPFFPCSAALCLTLCGACLVLISAAQAYPKWVQWLVPAGRISLTVLVIHLPLFRELSRPVHAWRNLSGMQTLGAIVIVIAACIVLARFWARANYRFGAEWLLRQADRLAPLRER